MPALSHAHASLCCNDFQFGYVPVPDPRAHLSNQDGPDSGPVVGFVELGEIQQIPTGPTRLFSVIVRKKNFTLCIPHLLLCAGELGQESECV